MSEICFALTQLPSSGMGAGSCTAPLRTKHILFTSCVYSIVGFLSSLKIGFILSYSSRFSRYYFWNLCKKFWIPFINRKKSRQNRLFDGLGEKIRTSGLLNPIQARYQTALHPDIRLSSALSNTVLSRTMCILALEYGYVNPFFRIFWIFLSDTLDAAKKALQLNEKTSFIYKAMQNLLCLRCG